MGPLSKFQPGAPSNLNPPLSGSNLGILHWDSPTRLPGNVNPSSPDVSLASTSLIPSTNWQLKTNLGSEHLPILISLKIDVTINPEKMRTLDDLRFRDSTLAALPVMNDEITRIANEHKRQNWRQFVGTLDHKTDTTNRWRTIQAI